MLEAVSEKGIRYEVKDCYLDYGQNWIWTTIIAHESDDRRYQALSPRQWKDICLATTISELAKIAKEISKEER